MIADLQSKQILKSIAVIAMALDLTQQDNYYTQSMF